MRQLMLVTILLAIGNPLNVEIHKLRPKVKDVSEACSASPKIKDTKDARKE